MYEPKITPTIIGNRIRKLIKESEHKTIEAFAAKIGYSVRQVSRMLNDGIRDISLIIVLCQALKIDYIELFKHIEEE